MIKKTTKMIDAAFFFFQAEDGIRDRTVTGVQTCALPIYTPQQGALWRTRLPEMPSSRTETWWVAGAASRRRARKSGQRSLALTVEPTPSVIESPRVTTARSGAGATTSTPSSQNHELTWVVKAPPAWSAA